MSLELIEVKTRKQLRQFIQLPAKIHKNHKGWLPPIYMDDRKFFNKKKNHIFDHCDTILLLAKVNNEFVGRIMGIINHKYNEAHNENHGRFCFMESPNDQQIANALIQAIENWSKEKGMTFLVGPLGFSDKDPQGMMVEGYDEPKVIATNCNFPYQVDLLVNQGFQKHKDCVVYRIDIPEEVPEFYQKIYERGLKANHVKVLDFETRKQIKPYIRPVLQLLNQTFVEIYAFAPLDGKEMDEFASRYLPILDPHFIKAVINDKKEVVAFIIAMPDISEGIKKCKGRILPFGILQVLASQRKTKQLDLLLGGIRSDYRNSGLDALMGVRMLHQTHQSGLKVIDTHLILESNKKMRAEAEQLGGQIYKRYRIFIKEIS